MSAHAIMPCIQLAISALQLSRAVPGQAHAKPPPLVELALAGVLTALRRPPDWDEAKRALGEASFLEQLLHFDKGALSDALLKSLTRFTGNPNFTPEVHASCVAEPIVLHALLADMMKWTEAVIVACRLFSACPEEREACACGCAQSVCMAASLATLRLAARVWLAPRQPWQLRKRPCATPRQCFLGRSRPSPQCR